MHRPPGPGPGAEQLCQQGAEGLASRAGLGGAREGGGVAENPHLRSHPASAHARGWTEKVGNPQTPAFNTFSLSLRWQVWGSQAHPTKLLQPTASRGTTGGASGTWISQESWTESLSLNKRRCRARMLAWPCGQPQALATHEAGWPSRPVETGWPQSLLLQKLNAQPGSATPRPALSSLARSCHVASPPTETQEVPTVEPEEWRHVGTRSDDTMVASRNVPTTACAFPGLQPRSRDPEGRDPSPPSTRPGAQHLFI